MGTRTTPSERPAEEPANERECRLTIIRSLAQRTSSRVAWFKTIGAPAAESATAGLLNCQTPVPRDILRLLDLPPKVTWARLAVFLRGSIPAEHGAQ
jgi:hypothetical protein